MNCPDCGAGLIRSSDYDDSLYKCPSCGAGFQAHPPRCSYPSCSDTDREGSQYCQFHPSRAGEREEREEPDTKKAQPDGGRDRYLPRVDAECSHRGCTNAATDNSDLCWYHQEKESHPDREPDPFSFRDQGSRATYPYIPEVQFGERPPSSRQSKGMGQGSDKPSKTDPLCRHCGEPMHMADGDDSRKCGNRENHERPEKPRRPEWPSGYPSPKQDEEAVPKKRKGWFSHDQEDNETATYEEQTEEDDEPFFWN